MTTIMKYIYKMSFYDSDRCIKPHTNMYYLKEEHTRWGHDRDLCRIFVIKVNEDSNEYSSALHNSSIDEK